MTKIVRGVGSVDNKPHHMPYTLSKVNYHHQGGKEGMFGM